MLRVVDLFSGCGGMTLGAALAAQRHGRRLEVALAVEANSKIAEIFRDNFKAYAHDTENFLQVRGVDELFEKEVGAGRRSASENRLRSQVGEVDLLVAGPPCQGHSDLNNHSRRQDQRNGLYGRAARAAEVLGPQVIVIENVPAVVHDRGRIVDKATDALRARYSIGHALLRFDRLGAPQRRKRHVLIGIRGQEHQELVDSIVRSLESGTIEEERTVDWAIRDLQDQAGTPGEGFDSPSVPSQENRARLTYFKKNRTRFDLPDAERPDCHKDGGHSYRAIYGRLRWDRPAQTITTGFGSMGQGRYVHPDASQMRTITPHEAARLQTFPDSFRFIEASDKRTVWAKAIGNAVPPLAMREVLDTILRALPDRR